VNNLRLPSLSLVGQSAGRYNFRDELGRARDGHGHQDEQQQFLAAGHGCRRARGPWPLDVVKVDIIYGAGAIVLRLG